jgi:hypothetical protein
MVIRAGEFRDVAEVAIPGTPLGGAGVAGQGMGG